MMLVDLGADEIGILLHALTVDEVGHTPLSARLREQLPPFEIRRPKARVNPEALPSALADGKFIRDWEVFAVHGDTCDDVVRDVAAFQQIHLLYDDGCACDVEMVDDSRTEREIDNESVLKEVADAGLTIVKLPDWLGSPYWRWYVVDLNGFVRDVFSEVFDCLFSELYVKLIQKDKFLDLHVCNHGAYSQDCFQTTYQQLMTLDQRVLTLWMDASGFTIEFQSAADEEALKDPIARASKQLQKLYNRWFDYMAGLDKE